MGWGLRDALRSRRRRDLYASSAQRAARTWTCGPGAPLRSYGGVTDPEPCFSLFLRAPVRAPSRKLATISAPVPATRSRSSRVTQGSPHPVTLLASLSSCLSELAVTGGRNGPDPARGPNSPPADTALPVYNTPVFHPITGCPMAFVQSTRHHLTLHCNVSCNSHCNTP